MDEEKIDQTIARGELEIRGSYKLGPTLGWMGTAFFVLVGIAAPHWGILIAGPLGAWSFYATWAARQGLQEHERNKARHLWEHLGGVHAFGQPHSLYTERLGRQIKRIYEADTAGLLLPLRQAVRVLDAYHLQQQRLESVKGRLEKMQGIADRIERLGKGENQNLIRSESAQINADLQILKRDQEQIEASCGRLELILTKIERTLETRQLHRELGELNLGRAPIVEPAFEPESLEDIERQIGREIETYLRLERETDERFQ